jgi:polysaccharide biosynthesis protein PslG
MRQAHWITVMLLLLALMVAPFAHAQDPDVHIVQRGETLASIARRYGTTIGALVALNNLPNPDRIVPGQQIRIRNAAQPPPADPATLPPNPDFNYGIEVFLAGQDTGEFVAQVEDLALPWVKLEVLWRNIEPFQGQPDFSTLDAAIDNLQQANRLVLLTITTAPDWARTSRDENGPPDNINDYANFVRLVAARYLGRVQAYEIWHEPNLRREWNSLTQPISATSYIEMLRTAHGTIKEIDPAAIVISAGLAPTGFNDGINAIDDRIYLQAMYAAGLAEVSDAVGAHPGGWANPPDARCCAASEGVTTHFEHRSFYFLETLLDYRQIMVAAGDSSTSVWVTRFGWGTSADTDEPEPINVYIGYNSPEEQAAYIPRAFEIGQSLGFVGPMFVSNLNGCQVQSSIADACYYSFLAPDGTPRPIYQALRGVDKTAYAIALPTQAG